MTGRGTIGRIALRMLCALALLFVSFAHQPPSAFAKSSDALSAAYMLPDGTFADLCLSDQAHDPDGKGIAKTGCEACRLQAALLFPQPSDVFFDAPRAVTVPAALPQAPILAYVVLSPNAPPRGPPELMATV